MGKRIMVRVIHERTVIGLSGRLSKKLVRSTSDVARLKRV